MPRRVQGWAPTVVGEYSYGAAVTYEVIEQLGGRQGLRAAPLVPSLRAEANLGFDVQISGQWATFYFQYKIGTLLPRGNPVQAARLGRPYFRFPVKTDKTSNGICQHNTLCDLQATTQGTLAYVYYVAPVFESSADFDEYMVGGTLVDHSVFVPPMAMGPVTPGTLHSFAYTSEADVTPFSTPGVPRSSTFSDVIDLLLTELFELGRNALRVTLNQHLQSTYRNIFQIDTVGQPPSYQGPASLARIAALLNLQVVVALVDQ